MRCAVTWTWEGDRTWGSGSGRAEYPRLPGPPVARAPSSFRDRRARPPGLRLRSALQHPLDCVCVCGGEGGIQSEIPTPARLRFEEKTRTQNDSSLRLAGCRAAPSGEGCGPLEPRSRSRPPGSQWAPPRRGGCHLLLGLTSLSSEGQRPSFLTRRLPESPWGCIQSCKEPSFPLPRFHRAISVMAA